MKRTLVVIFGLIAIPVVGTLMWELAYNDYADKAKAIAATAEHADLACGQIGDLIGTLTNLGTHQFQGAVHDARSGVDHDGCRTGLSARHVTLIDGHWPHEALRQQLPADHWREDLSGAADGPGSTAFAMRRDSVTCLFSASWTLGDWADPEPVADEYRLGVGCFRNK